MMNAKTYTSQNNYDDFCDINAETSLFCGLDYDEFNKTSYFVGSIMTNSIKRHKVLGLRSIPSNSSYIVCNCDALLKCHKIFVIDHHISCSVCRVS